MKAILISINPKWVAKILNGEKTLEIRKTLPKCKLPIDVYIYCTKDNQNTLMTSLGGKYIVQKGNMTRYFAKNWKDEKHPILNGKVVAKFTLKEIRDVYAIHFPNGYHYRATDLTTDQLEQKSCLSQLDLNFYLRKHKGYAWQINDLFVFSKPKTLSDFLIPSHKVPGIDRDGSEKTFTILKPLNRAPQSWCFVEI